MGICAPELADMFIKLNQYEARTCTVTHALLQWYMGDNITGKHLEPLVS